MKTSTTSPNALLIGAVVEVFILLGLVFMGVLLLSRLTNIR